MSSKKSYGADSIQILEGLDAVRVRPGMYIGSTGSKGLHHLIWEILDNSIDEFLAGHGTEISVTLNSDGSVTVSDNGRGIPTELHKLKKRPTVEIVLTTLHAGGKFDNDSYTFSGGLHGVGLSVVNALSSNLKVEIFRDGKYYTQEYEKGIPLYNLKTSKGKGKKTGTQITFVPDTEIFETVEFDYKTIENRMRELAYLNKNLKLIFNDNRRVGKETRNTFCYSGGLYDYVNDITQKDQLVKPFYCSEKTTIKGRPAEVEIALTYRNKSSMEEIISFTNNIKTIDGGTHVSGFKSSFTRIINDLAKLNGTLKKQDENFQGNDIREGLCAIISIKLTEVQFESQTKSKLGSTDAVPLVSNMVSDKLKELFIERNKDTQKILQKINITKKARDAARKAKANVINKESVFKNVLPGKLYDCLSKNIKNNEIFIVEGNSAGGSAKQGRDPKHQAILPIRGKILNVEKSTMDKITSNEEIRSLVLAFGCGFGDSFDISKLRYGKIIIMTDADADGLHIGILLLTFIFRYMEELIYNGHVYVANPPLYEIIHKNKSTYALSEKEKNSVIGKLDKQNKNYKLTRFKGLGEMDPEQLWETTMHPDKRLIHKITIEDQDGVDAAFVALMGNDANPRKEFIKENQWKIDTVDLI